MRDVIKMAQAIKLLLALLLSQFLAAHVDDPVVWQVSADATPVATKERRSMMLNGKTFQRVGEAKQDFLLQRVFLSCAQHLRWPRQAVCVPEPIPMENGKTCWHVWAAQRRFLKDLLQAGHRSAQIFFHCWDRGLFSA